MACANSRTLPGHWYPGGRSLLSVSNIMPVNFGLSSPAISVYQYPKLVIGQFPTDQIYTMDFYLYVPKLRIPPMLDFIISYKLLILIEKMAFVTYSCLTSVIHARTRVVLM